MRTQKSEVRCVISRCVTGAILAGAIGVFGGCEATSADEGGEAVSSERQAATASYTFGFACFSNYALTNGQPYGDEDTVWVRGPQLSRAFSSWPAPFSTSDAYYRMTIVPMETVGDNGNVTGRTIALRAYAKERVPGRSTPVLKFRAEATGRYRSQALPADDGDVTLVTTIPKTTVHGKAYVDGKLVEGDFPVDLFQAVCFVTRTPK